ncbi:purine-nucleoside phosphorylase [bacterium]|nr:purine-nucleoside phosphorylase [bacterium]
MTKTLNFLRDRIKTVPEILIILGSGFAKVADKMKIRVEIPYQDIPHFKKTSAPTHSGNLIAGKINGRDVLVMQGRYHVYEGYEISFTTYPVRVAAELGVKKLITTNLSGGINENFNIGDFMLVKDHLNVSGVNPLIWDSGRTSGQFTDMYEAYSSHLIRLLERSASELGITLHKGVLAYLTGPNFETRSELKMLKLLGADAVGWSLVPEVLEARRYGMDVLGIVCISDLSNPDSFNPVNLEEIYQIGKEKADTLFLLLASFMSKLQNGA